MIKPKIGLVALIALSSCLVAGQAATPAAVAIATDPPLVRGVVYDATGSPMAGATVTLAVDHFLPGGAIRPEVFATTTADERGRYSINGAIPGVDGATDHVELMLSATLGDQNVDHVIQVEPNVGAIDTSERRRPATRLGRVRLQMGQGALEASTRPHRTTDRGAVEPSTDPDLSDDGGVAPRQGATGCMALYQAVWVPDYSVTRTRYIPVQRVTTGAHSTQTYDWRSTSNLLKVQWEFVRYQLACVQGYSYQTYWLNRYDWRPERYTGGSSRPYSSPTWQCPSEWTTNFGSTTQVARGSVVTWTASFSLAGVGLDVKQTNATSQELTVTPDRNESAPRVCGDDDWPAQADRVQEKR